MSRVKIFVVQIVWLVILGVLAATYFSDVIHLKDTLGSVPLAVVWFGALGAVLISLTGIVEHAHDWDESLALWHLSRPLVGASLAVVGVLIIQAGVLATGSPTTPKTPANPAIAQNLLYYLVAFLVGYREETFRELIKRLVDLIFAPGSKQVAPTITSLVPNTGPAAGGVPVVISGSGFTGATAVTFGSNPAGFQVDSDSQITVAQIPAGTAGQKMIVTVKGKSGSATASFQY
jgi:IPT/TIG domain